MPEEVTNISEIKTSSDGTVKISVEKYNEMVEKIAKQGVTLEDVQARLRKALAEPPVVNRTIVNKTDEMLAREHKVSGVTMMGLGASLFVFGALRYKAGISLLA